MDRASGRLVVATAFASVMALAGFLLFQVQPMLAKYILPWFGGSATTWIVCMLFFQVALLAGYALAYLVTLPFPVATQAKVQLALLALVLLFLPITPSESWKPGAEDDPTWRIVALLAASVGLPYMALATTSPLLSRWLASAGAGLDPARFFAASNFGSFLGLLSYPFVFERMLSSGEQTTLWSWAFVVYAALFAFCAWIAMRAAPEDGALAAPQAARAPIHAPMRAAGEDAPALWILYSALGSILLLATTNAITQWSAVVPFLWIAPLSLYLLTFVIAFGGQGLYRRGPFALAFLLLGGVTLMMTRPETSADLLAQLALQSATLFVGCMICHGEMVRLQPPPARLPKFYLAISFGGALGGVAVALLAPLVLRDYFEHQIVLTAIGAAAAWILWRELRVDARSWRTPAAGVAGVFFLFGVGVAIHDEARTEDVLVERVRNFYGVLRVVKEDERDPEHFSLVMQQAGVDQGSQYQKVEKHLEPSCGFDADSALGLVFDHHAKRRADPKAPLRIGVVGLGAGMVAGLGRAGDMMRYYELNPAVLDIVNRRFYFLKETRAQTDVLLGDGRLVLERQLAAGQKQNFDVLVMNAFRGASPPMHLMTQEAFEVYLAHLAPDGVLAINFELDTFEMAPLHRGMARRFGLDVRWFETAESEECEQPISWALYTRDKAFFETPEVKEEISEWRDKGRAEIVWTDKSSNLMSILNWGD
ncbi:MAG: fused MFS/spermidine synthase [Beijerinckiaceae bacterium]